MLQKIKFLLIFLLLATLVYTDGCKTASVRNPREKDGKIYSVTRGLFRHKWWHYYERSLSFADGGFWKDAELDLRVAVRKRDKDQRRARTYGMHFIDYFPHCELGVSLYNQALADNSADRLRESVHELEQSVEMVKSAKAEYYLDLARKSLVEMGTRDQRPPEITIESPVVPYLTNAFSVAIQGTARDKDNYVRYITVSGKKARIDVSNREIPFRMEVPVKPGKNEIQVKAVNLTGKTCETVVTVNVDRIGPVIGNDGYVFDDSGLTEIVINGDKFPVDANEINIRDIISSLPDEKEMTVDARDRAGNVTSAKIARIRPAGFPKPRRSSDTENILSGYLFAENAVSPEKILSDASEKAPFLVASGTGPHFVKIELRKKATERITFLDGAVIDGKISSDEPLTELVISGDKGNEILKLKTPRSIYHFSCLAQLREGENYFDIKAVSRSRKSDEITLKIDRKIHSVKKTEARLKLAVNKFTREKTQDVEIPLSVGFESSLATALSGHEPERFAKVRELNPEQGKSADEEKARQTAKEKGFHCIMFGKILERKNSQGKNSLVIKARLEDTEGNSMVKEKETEVYGEDADRDNIYEKLNSLSEYMKTKLIDELPVVEGKIVNKKKDMIVVDMGLEKKVKKGLDIIVYQLAEAFEDFGFDQESDELGEAKIRQVKKGASLAKLKKEANKEEIQPEHYVITR